MAQNLNVIKARIKSIEGTSKVTRAMEVVSSVKLNRVKAMLHASRAYFARIESLLCEMMANVDNISSPLAEKRSACDKIALCVMASDAGLCNVYNYSVINAAEDFISKFPPGKIVLVLAGKEAHSHFKKKAIPIAASYTELHGRYSDEISKKMCGSLVGMFLNKDVDQAYIAYTHFGSTLRHKPAVEKFLNLEFKPCEKKTEYIIEPDASGVLEALVPHYIEEKFRLALLNAFTSEHSARMVAMKSATDNARELIDTLTLLRNKARQASITKEVIEIASAAEALKG